MTPEFTNKVYDILVSIGGAQEDMRDNFVYVHGLPPNLICLEYRFQGKLGFGGKYRSKTNKVDCYKEDETPERLTLIKEINVALSKINN